MLLLHPRPLLISLTLEATANEGFAPRRNEEG